MLAQQNGKVAVAALGTLLAGSGLGWVPVARFVAPRVPLRVVCPPEPARPAPPAPIAPNASRARFRAGPLTVDAMLGQSAIHAGSDGLLYVDVKLTADSVPDDTTRRPIDFALVLDTSGSMADENKIGLLKAACLDLEKRLQPEDRVAVVNFSTGAQTQLPLGAVSGQAYRSAIQRLFASGGTNISAGLELGAEELRKAVRPGAARRLILLTDGQPTPNAGEWTPEGLCGVVKRLEQQGISVSTVGLGLDYNAKLLSDMAEAGGGAYHYVDAAARIAGIYDSELSSMRALVARGVKVTLEPAPGVELVDLIEWNGERGTGHRGAVVRAGDFESGRATKIVARVRACSWKDGCEGRGSAVDVLSVSVQGEDARGLTSFASSAPTLGVALTSDLAVARASVTAEARKDVEDAQVSELVEKVRASAERGDRAKAREYVQELKGKRATLGYTARDGKEERMDVQKLADALEGDDAEARTRALMFSRSAAGAAGR